MSSDGNTLKNAFLDEDNNLRWGQLGGAIAGAGVYEFFRNLAGIPLGIGRAISEFFGGIQSASARGGSTLSAAIREAGNAFGAADAGVFSFPVTAGLILLSVAIIVIGFREVVFDG